MGDKRQKHYQNHVKPGQTGFFTTTVLDFARAFHRPEMREEMTRSLVIDLIESQTKLRAFVVMPHHLHFLVTLPETLDGAHLMNKIKRNSAKRMLSLMTSPELRQLNMQRALNDRAFWKSSYRSLEILTSAVLQQKIDYIHANPVRAELCEDCVGFRWSSAWMWQEERFVGEDYVLRLETIAAEFGLGGW